MTAKLSVIKSGGSPGPDAELVAHAEDIAAKLVAAAKEGHGFWVMIDLDEPVATWGGDGLEMSATAEEAAREMKRTLLGFE